MADPDTTNQVGVTISPASAERAPFIYFDGVSCFGHHNGTIQIELERKGGSTPTPTPTKTPTKTPSPTATPTKTPTSTPTPTANPQAPTANRETVVDT